MKVSNIVWDAVIKTISKKKKSKKAKWLSEEALQIAMRIREVKGKGEKERSIHLNTEFQRIARRDKKAFLSDQCKQPPGKPINTGVGSLSLFQGIFQKSNQGLLNYKQILYQLSYQGSP